MEQNLLFFEQPLNEFTRIILRIEYLFQKLDYYFQLPIDQISTRAILSVIFDLLSMTGRSDFKSKIITILAAQSQNAKALNLTQEEVDEIHHLRLDLLKIETKIANNLRTDDFLTLICQKAQTPGGDADFQFFYYSFWLKQPPEKITHFLNNLRQEFLTLEKSIAILLKILRTTNVTTEKKALKGFYQENFPIVNQYQLMRVAPLEKNIYPDISVGKQRFSIYFLVFDNTSLKKVQKNTDIPFLLELCQLYI